MLIIGERINATRKSINKAIEKKDVKFIQQEAIKQVQCGAEFLDVNCGINIKDELDNMEWLVKIVQEVINVPLVIDSPNANALERGLMFHKGKPIINSVTAEEKRYEKILPLVKKYNTSVIALTIDEKGMPKTAEERFNIAKKIVRITTEYGILPEDVFFDPLVRPISTEPEQVKEFLESLRLIKTLPQVKTICGLSNVSYGLPNRSLLNSIFIAIALGYGLDSAIIDPTDKKMISAIKTAEALLGKDEYCLSYITAYREGKV